MALELDEKLQDFMWNMIKLDYSWKKKKKKRRGTEHVKITLLVFIRYLIWHSNMFMRAQKLLITSCFLALIQMLLFVECSEYSSWVLGQKNWTACVYSAF